MTSTTGEYRKKVKKMVAFLGGRCVKCGTTESLNFDHIDHLTKSFDISQNWGRSWEVLEPELRKCQLLCKLHHLEKSKDEGSLSKGWTNQPRQTHGTVWSYSKYKCRCHRCKEAKAEANKKQRKPNSV